MKVYLEPWATAPTRAHSTDAGLDLYAPFDFTLLAKGGSKTIDTGVHIRLPHRTFGKIESKSGLNVNHGIVACGGVIDEGYNGSIAVKLYNLSGHKYSFRKGEKIAQLIVQPCFYEPVVLTTEDDYYGIRTDRGSNGFGSTGK